jgi:hypothetical protein
VNPIYASLEPTSTQHRLGSPKIIQALDEGEFLDLLNSPGTPADQLRPYSSADVLRGWVDEWLDSGFSQDGAEHPRNRRLGKASNGGAAKAAFDYSQGKMSLLPDGEGDLALWLDEPDRPKFSYIFTLHDSYAQRFLVFFLLSDLRHTLAKCRDKDCGRYFILKRWNQTYSRGTKCDVHQRASSLESAKKATSADRLNAETALYGLAAKRFTKVIQSNQNWHKDPKVKTMVAVYLNDRISRSAELAAVYLSGGRKGITSKWTAWAKNWQGIEKALKAISKTKTKPRLLKNSKR